MPKLSNRSVFIITGLLMLVIVAGVGFGVYNAQQQKEATERERRAEIQRQENVVTIAKGTFDVAFRTYSDILQKNQNRVYFQDVLKAKNGLTLSDELQTELRNDSKKVSALSVCRSQLSDEIVDQGFHYRNVTKLQPSMYTVDVEWDGIDRKANGSKPEPEEKNPSRVVANVDTDKGVVTDMRCDLLDTQS